MLQIQEQINKMLIEPMMKPMQVERKIVKFRRLIYTIMHNPNRIQNVQLPTQVAIRIEKYTNKQRILVFTNAEDVYLKPFSKTIHT